MNSNFTSFPLYTTIKQKMGKTDCKRTLTETNIKTFMSYFKKLPNILYQSPLPDKSSSGDLIEIKNIFRRSKLYDYLKSPDTHTQEKNIINYIASNRHNPRLHYPLSTIYSNKRL